MTILTQTPEIPVCTGGVDAMAGALLTFGGARNPNMLAFFHDCVYCIDAPDFMPAGSCVSCAASYVKRAA